MKFTAVAVSALVVAASVPANSFAFTRPVFVARTQSNGVALHMTDGDRPDTSAAVEAAMKASDEFGPQSKEARLAWEVVEEMDASDNSAAFKGGINEDECLADESNKDCVEYYDKLAQLSKIITDQKPNIDKVKDLVEQVKNVKVAEPEPAAPPKRDSDAMEKALAEAKAATEKYGITSPEAKLAWEALEEIASSDFSEATKGTLDEACLVETIEACEAIETLQKVLDAEQVRMSL